MRNEWKALVGSLALTRDRTAFKVDLERGRAHLVEVLEHEDDLELSGLVATARELRAVGLRPADLWSRNRSRKLTGYVVDADGAAWVKARLPLAGLSSEELHLVVTEVAREADRLEYLVAGSEDRY